MSMLDPEVIDTLFLGARTHGTWRDEPVPDAVLRQLYETVRWAPTMGNSQPMRLVFIRTPEAKARLKPLLSPGNVDKTMAAPVTALVAHDLAFYEQLPTLAPHATGMRDRMAALPEEQLAQLAQTGSSMQGAYVILAARALGLDCGPMGGFNKPGVDEEFLAGTTWRSNFLLNLGYGDHAGLQPRAPRLDFDHAARLL
jgi:3-hydroxypropanoate dehydrogenase